MSNKSNETQNFFTEFLEDYFAECEEHLAAVRHQLLVIESCVDQPTLDRNSINELFRCFHSLKGLSGMVGIRDAEELAHQMESYLRSLRDTPLKLSPAGFDALMVGTKTLDQVIASQRHGAATPDISPVLAQLAMVIPQEPPQPAQPVVTPVQLQLKEADTDRLNQALVTGSQAWHFVFAPTPLLSQKGINVNRVREELQRIGKLIQGTPRMVDNGKIIFDFIVVSEAAQVESLISWTQTFPPVGNGEGLTWLPYTPSPSIPPAPTPETSPPAPTAPASDPDSESVSPVTPPLITPSSHVVRVDLSKLDELMRMVGDLVISRARLADQLQRLQAKVPMGELRPLQEVNLTLERQLRDLREGVMRVRLVPIGEIFARMQFVVRDLMRESDKQIALEVVGQETEIDKFVVERMMDPLLHLVRNAVSHGIETPQERLKAGKSSEGNLLLKATTAGETVIIEVQDDGVGINLDKVLARAKSQGLLTDQEDWDQQTYDPLTPLELLCLPGFSTREQADLVSGRGVGMAVVKNTVQELGGVITLQTQPGHGTHFTIQLPLTLAIADALIIACRHQIFAIPQSAVQEVIEMPVDQITHLENNLMISYRGRVLSLIHLAELFNLETPTPSQTTPPFIPIVIIASVTNMIGVVVDQLIGLREIVVRSLTDPLVQVIGVAGATELGDGRIVLILDTASLLRVGEKIQSSKRRQEEIPNKTLS